MPMSGCAHQGYAGDPDADDSTSGGRMLMQTSE
jgi:hypothetical protein